MNKENLPVTILAVVLFFNAASYITNGINSVKNIKSDTVKSDELKKVAEEFNKIESKDDKLLIYKLFAGSAEYLKTAETLKNTGQFDAVLGKVQSSYGWNREKYPKFTDAVSSYLVSEKYDEPKQLSTREDKEKFADIFNKMSEAIK